MKLVLRVFATAFVLVTLFGVGLYMYGKTLPLHHIASVKVDLPVKKEQVWPILVDYENLPKWWSDVQSVTTEVKPSGQKISWNLDQHGQKIGFVTIIQIENKKLVRQIESEGQPFGGTWTFELEDKGEGSTLKLTEAGFVTSPFYRAVMVLFIGTRKTMNSFTESLAKKIKGA